MLTLDSASIPEALALAGFPVPRGWTWNLPAWDYRDSLYLARGPSMTLKIGVAYHVPKRVRQLNQEKQSARIGAWLGVPCGPHRLILAIRPGNIRGERHLMKLVAHERVRTEWFRGPDSELLISALCSAAVANSKTSEAA